MICVTTVVLLQGVLYHVSQCVLQRCCIVTTYLPLTLFVCCNCCIVTKLYLSESVMYHKVFNQLLDSPKIICSMSNFMFLVSLVDIGSYWWFCYRAQYCGRVVCVGACCNVSMYSLWSLTWSWWRRQLCSMLSTVKSNKTSCWDKTQTECMHWNLYCTKVCIKMYVLALRFISATCFSAFYCCIMNMYNN